MTSAIRANWRLAELDTDSDDDPFAEIVPEGCEIDLRASPDELFAQLQRTLRREARLAERDIGCALRENGTDCLSCTKYTEDQSVKRWELCVLGREQRLLEVAHEEQLLPVRELADRHAEFQALVPTC